MVIDPQLSRFSSLRRCGAPQRLALVLPFALLCSSACSEPDEAAYDPGNAAEAAVAAPPATPEAVTPPTIEGAAAPAGETAAPAGEGPQVAPVQPPPAQSEEPESMEEVAQEVVIPQVEEEQAILVVEDQPEEMKEHIDESGIIGGIAECAGVVQEAERLGGPVDIIFVIDNSSTMNGEIVQVQERINEDFAELIRSSGVDYRVIMMSRYGDVDIEIGHSNNPICIHEPLGVGDCSAPMEQQLEHNPPYFYHYSLDVRSREPWCDVLQGFAEPDELRDQRDARDNWVSIAPNGYQEFLRPEAKKHFVVITDDGARCDRIGYAFLDRNNVETGIETAQEFDTALLALSPEQFGTAEQRKYIWHSIVAMSSKESSDPGMPPPAWLPDEPIITDECPNEAVAPGTGYQALSVMTGGLRYSSCDNENFDAVFRALAEGAIKGALACDWEIPEAPDNRELNPEEVNVRFRPAGSGVEQAVSLPNVGSLDKCPQTGGWYYDNVDKPTEVISCPNTCELLKSDPDGRVEIEFGCKTVVFVPPVQ